MCDNNCKMNDYNCKMCDYNCKMCDNVLVTIEFLFFISFTILAQSAPIKAVRKRHLVGPSFDTLVRLSSVSRGSVSPVHDRNCDARYRDE